MTKLTKAEQRFLCIIHTASPEELEALFVQAGLSDAELEALRKIMEE